MVGSPGFGTIFSRSWARLLLVSVGSLLEDMMVDLLTLSRKLLANLEWLRRRIDLLSYGNSLSLNNNSDLCAIEDRGVHEEE